MTDKKEKEISQVRISKGVYMNLYDNVVRECFDILSKYNGRKLNIYDSAWEQEREQRLILKSEMAYELGGNSNWAISGLAFTNPCEDMKDEIWLYGSDLKEITEDTDYARLTVLSVDDKEWNDSDKAYAGLQKIDYTRYHVYPKGFMMRISSSAEREPVRISKEAIQEGLDFEKVGNVFVKKYHSHKEVKAVKIIFITEKNFPYELFKDKAEKMEMITESLNKIFGNLIMDCTTCSLKKVCDEVEGMKEVHFGIINK